MKSSLGFLLLMIAWPVNAIAQDCPDQPATLIERVRVFDGEQVYDDRSVLIEGSRIVSADHEGPPPPCAVVVDGTGRTLLPGLIDAHVHVPNGFEDALLFGVTTLIDLFSDPEEVAEIRARTLSGDNPHEPDVWSAGTVATAPGGHGTQYGREIPTLTTPQEAEAFVADRIAEGSQHIKIIRASNRPTLDEATIGALSDAAHRHGLLAVAHAATRADTRAAMAGRVDGLVHGASDAVLDADLVSEIAAKGVFVSPTFAVAESAHGRAGSAPLVEREWFTGLLSEAALANLSRPAGFWDDLPIEVAEPIINENIRLLHAAGVPILAGSDAPNRGTWFGISLHREIELLVHAGLTPIEALIAATSAPADAYRIAGHGRIADGFAADLLLVEGDPTTHITDLGKIVEVWKDGQRVERVRRAN